MLKAHEQRCNCTAFCRISNHFVTPKGMTSGKHYLFCFNLGTDFNVVIVVVSKICRGLWNPKSEAPIWMAAIVICLGAIVIYLSTYRPSHRPWSHVFTSSTESKFHSASLHTMPFTPAHLQSFLDAESSQLDTAVAIAASKSRLRPGFDWPVMVDAQWTAESISSMNRRMFGLHRYLLIFCVFNLSTLPTKKSHPKPLQSQCDFLDFAGVKTGSADQSWSPAGSVAQPWETLKFIKYLEMCFKVGEKKGAKMQT